MTKRNTIISWTSTIWLALGDAIHWNITVIQSESVRSRGTAPGYMVLHIWAILSIC